MTGHDQVLTLAHAATALAEPATWDAADVRREPPEGWDGLERMAQVVARQRRSMNRDLVAAVGFAALAIAVVVALL